MTIEITYNTMYRLWIYNFLSGKLMIIYYNHPDSRQLGPDTLYNPNIYCTRTQRELQDLVRNDRFISVYNTLTDKQKQKVLDTVSSWP